MRDITYFFVHSEEVCYNKKVIFLSKMYIIYYRLSIMGGIKVKKIELKTKLIILGICGLLLLTLFAIGVKLKYDEKSEDKLILREGEMITTKEVKYLLSFLAIEEIELLKEDTFFTFKDFQNTIPYLANKLSLDEDSIQDKASFKIQEEDQRKAVLVKEFLEIYESCIESMEAEDSLFKENKLFLVGIPDEYKDNESNNIMSTDLGKFDVSNTLDYGSFHINDELRKQEDYKLNYHEFKIDDFINHKVNAVVYDDKILYVKEILAEETILYNAWITKGSDKTINAFIHGVTKQFETRHSLSKEISEVVGDIAVENREVVGIRMKPDRIDGKVLLTDKEYIEVEGYGKIPLDENYKIYKIYGELAQELTNNILVGYETTDFIVANGKIVSALIKGPIKAENIRVLLKTKGFENYYHQGISFTSDKDFSVTSLEEITSYPAGTTLTYNVADDALSKGRLTIRPDDETGKITILSMERSYGNPSYRGAVELAPTDNGILIVNELPLEEYLYAVIPSEMPSYYSMEALKSQAVCARSYAYNHLISNSLKEYGAHVDDSVSYQVYNNHEENEETILAVKDTYGKVLTHGGLVVDAYYFSTSSGHTASVGEVWNGDAQYLIGKLQQVQNEDVVPVAYTDKEIDFSNEETFRNFILNPTYQTYDSEFAWYRWKVNLPFKELSNSINSKIGSRYKANPDYIQTLSKNDEGEEVFESLAIDSIGNLQDIQILKREKSGIITEIKLVGDQRTVKIIGEYNIRMLLSPGDQKIVRQDGSEVSQSMLPSAFFIMDKGNTDITISGGGYGHGVGMSQNGAKAMADMGKEYNEILKHYYSGAEIGYIYE